MLSQTEIANNALSYLSAGRIITIDDTLDEKARTIKAIFETTSMEVIREHRWSCCVRRVQLARLAESPTKVGNFGYTYAYQLPVDILRFLDLNGEPWKVKTQFLDVNGDELHCNEAEAYIRYVANITDTSQWDVLLAKAVAVAIAAKVARRITKDGMSAEQLIPLYERVVAQAKHVDAMEVGSGENSPLERIIESSGIINAGRHGSTPSGIASILGYNLDLSEPR
jgi:hypothetical protein